MFHLNARWDVLRLDTKNKVRSSFRMDFVKACKAVLHKSVAERTAYERFKIDFGTRLHKDGTSTPSADHTTPYPQKSDSCGTCEMVRAEIRSNAQSLLRHRKQGDKTLPRLQAIREHEEANQDPENSLKAHTLEASRACDYQKTCIKDAESIYQGFCDEVTILCATDPLNASTAIADFAPKASISWFDVSTDYQQDKFVLAWNKNPQPRPTYYISGITNYFLILLINSSGRADDDRKLSRNFVYV